MKFQVEKCKSYARAKLELGESIANVKSILESDNLRFESLVGTITDLQRVGNDAVGLIHDNTGFIRSCFNRNILKSLEVGCTIEIHDFSAVRVTKYSKFLVVVPCNLKTVYPKNGECAICMILDDQYRDSRLVDQEVEFLNIGTNLAPEVERNQPTPLPDDDSDTTRNMPIAASARNRIEQRIGSLTSAEIGNSNSNVKDTVANCTAERDLYFDAELEMNLDFDDWEGNPVKRVKTSPQMMLQDLDMSIIPEIGDEDWLNEDVF